MTARSQAWIVALVGAGLMLASTDSRAQPAPEVAAAAPAHSAAIEKMLEPQALDLLRAMSERLAAARTLGFTAVTTYEGLSRLGQPLAFDTVSDVVMQRPDKLRVITPGDGPASEFVYNGATMAAYAPAERLVAVADAPPTIDAMLRVAYTEAAIYFPFTDMIVADPYNDFLETLDVAYVLGQSRVVGNVLTDMVVIAGGPVHAQLWIGAEDKLPRMMRATFADEPARFRHQVEFRDWRLDAPLAPDAFASTAPADAGRMPFARPPASQPRPDTPTTAGTAPKAP